MFVPLMFLRWGFIQRVAEWQRTSITRLRRVVEILTGSIPVPLANGKYGNPGISMLGKFFGLRPWCLC